MRCGKGWAVSNANPIIVALDGLAHENVLRMAENLAPYVWGFKINDALLRYGWYSVADVVGMRGVAGTNVMLDLKLYDIPNTVFNHAKAIMSSSYAEAIKIVTVHAHGGPKMMKSAVDVLGQRVAAVTVLTSFDEGSYADVHYPFLSTEIMMRPSITSQVENLANLAKMAGCGHIVCSGQELVTMSHLDIKKIVPGIRPAWHCKADDQKRTMTPKQAIDAGASYLVIGRPIIEAENPVDAAKRTLEEIHNG